MSERDGAHRRIFFDAIRLGAIRFDAVKLDALILDAVHSHAVKPDAIRHDVIKPDAVKLTRQSSPRPSGHIHLFVAAGFIPESQFHAVPKAQLVVDEAEIVFDHMLSRAEGIGDFAVFAAFGYALNNDLFAFAGAA